jgi:uncharacterized protein YceK
MKSILLVLAVCGGLAGCAAYVDPYGGYGARVNVPAGHSGYRDGGQRQYRDRDRDGDGVPNRYDSRPANPRRY